MNFPTDFIQNFLSQINLPLILLAISLCLYVSYVFAVLYHLIRFGIGVRPKLISLIFFIGSTLLLLIALGAYGSLDFKILAKGLEQNFGENIKNFFFFTSPKL